MSNSPLVNYTLISPHSNARNHSIDKITIHHMAGNLSVESCGRVFQTREASANYGIGTDGRVGLYVPENRRAWASANPENDHRAINIELANDGYGPNWHVSDTAINKCIDLCVDICRRNGIKQINYTGGKNGNLTYHSMFINTTCPGPYLKSKFPYIAQQINTKLGNGYVPAYALDVDGLWGQATTTRLQQIFGTPIDGIVSDQYLAYKSQNPGLLSETFEWKQKPYSSASDLIRAIQKKVGVTADGYIGPETIKAMQKWLGTPVDGVCDDPSEMVKALQRWANAQK